MRLWRLPKRSDFRWLPSRPPARERRRRTGWSSIVSAARLARGDSSAHPEAPGLLEEFLVGDEHTFDSVTVGGETVFSSIRLPAHTARGAPPALDPVDRGLAPGAERPAV